MKSFVFVIILLAAEFGAEALLCYNILEYDCTAYDDSLLSACRDVEAENTRSIETCASSENYCYYSTFFVDEPGLYNLTTIIGGCDYNDINGCYTRSQLAIIDPTFEYALDDIEDDSGFNIQGFQACFCTTNLCNTGLPNQGGVTPKQGGVTPKQGGVTPKQGGATPKQGGVKPEQRGVTPKQGVVTPPRSNSPLLVQTSSMIVGLMAFTALLPMIDFTVM